jgi:hypothetical protein
MQTKQYEKTKNKTMKKNKTAPIVSPMERCLKSIPRPIYRFLTLNLWCLGMQQKNLIQADYPQKQNSVLYRGNAAHRCG